MKNSFFGYFRTHGISKSANSLENTQICGPRWPANCIGAAHRRPGQFQKNGSKSGYRTRPFLSMIDRAEKQGQMTSDEPEQILRADETRDRKKPVVSGSVVSDEGQVNSRETGHDYIGRKTCAKRKLNSPDARVRRRKAVPPGRPPTVALKSEQRIPCPPTTAGRLQAGSSLEEAVVSGQQWSVVSGQRSVASERQSQRLTG